MKLSSSVFKNEDVLPEKYTCLDENVNPPLKITEAPKETKSLVLIMEDPDAPSGLWTHWLVWNIKPDTKEILEDNVPPEAVLGTNDFSKIEYSGPCPPSGTHRYFFKVFALDVILNVSEGADRDELEEAMEDHVLDSSELVALFSKDNAPV